jgi:L-serine deaminase
MLFKRGSTISAAEGGCQAEVGGRYSITNFFMCIYPEDTIPTVACSMAGAGFAACMGGILRSLGGLVPV